MPTQRARNRRSKISVRRPAHRIYQGQSDPEMDMAILGAFQILEDAQKVPFADIERPTAGVYKDILNSFHEVIDVSPRDPDGNFSVQIQDDELGRHKTDAYGWYVRLVGMDYELINV